MNKEIFAALEIADHEIRLIVCEFHNFKLNVLKVERVETSGVSHVSIVNEEAVISSIQKAVENASRLLGAEIKRVILIVPSYHMNRYAKRVIVNTSNGVVEKEDILSALRTARYVDIPSDSEIVQIIPIRYIANGYPSKRIPLNEKSDTLGVEVEIFTADKEMVYQYVSAVENAGIKVIDICLDSYGLASETSLFAQAVGRYILMMRLERQTTTLSLLANGKLVNSTVVDSGYGDIIGAINEEFGLPFDVCNRLLLYNFEIGKEDLGTSPIYYWTVDGIPYTISEKQVYEKAMPLLQKWADKLKDITKDVLATENVTCVISGEGADIQKIDTYLTEQFGIDCQCYTPDTLGIRNGAWAAVAGSIYAYYDQRFYLLDTTSSIDNPDYLGSVQPEKKEEPKASEDTLSGRIRKIIKKN